VGVTIYGIKGDIKYSLSHISYDKIAKIKKLENRKILKFLKFFYKILNFRITGIGSRPRIDLVAYHFSPSALILLGFTPHAFELYAWNEGIPEMSHP